MSNLLMEVKQVQWQVTTNLFKIAQLHLQLPWHQLLLGCRAFMRTTACFLNNNEQPFPCCYAVVFFSFTIRYSSVLLLFCISSVVSLLGFHVSCRISCQLQYVFSPASTQSLRASVSSSRAVWQGLTLAVTRDRTFDRHCCLSVHSSI